MVYRYRLRLCRVVEEIAAQFFSVEPSEAAGRLEALLNAQPSWLYQQPYRRRVAGRTVDLGVSDCLLNGGWKLILASPRNRKADWHADVVSAVQPTRDDRALALAGVEVNSRIQVLPSNHQAAVRTAPVPVLQSVMKQETDASMVKLRTAPVCVQCGYVNHIVARFCESCGVKIPIPTGSAQPAKAAPASPSPLCPNCNSPLVNRGLYCQRCGFRLPDELAVHPEFAVAVKSAVYRQLADFAKARIEAVWGCLVRGHSYRKLWLSEYDCKQLIFLFTLNGEKNAVTVAEVQSLDELLADAGAGCVITDPYELRQIHGMLNVKSPQHESLKEP